MWIPGVIEATKKAYYLSCQTCKKKVTEDDNRFFCLNCNKTYDSANPSYIFSAKICDYSESTFVSFLGETGNAVMGMDAAIFHDTVTKSEDEEGALKSIIEESYFKPIALLIRAKRESYNGG